MILTYIDESGINYKNKNGVFEDGPFIVWCGLLIPEEKYFHLERMFYELIRKKLKIKDWGEIELHATDIWARKNNFSYLTEKDSREYFEEFAQLLKKLDLQIILGVKRKEKKLRSKSSKNEQINKAIYAFLHGLEHKLSNLNQATVAIFDGDQSARTSFEELYFERTKWRYNPGAKKKMTVKSKYYFESLSCFLLDQVHKTNSKSSLFVQVADNITFILRRVLEHSYYSHNPNLKVTPDIKMVPISSSTFAWLGGNVQICYYSDKRKDVILPSDQNFFHHGNDYVHRSLINEIE